MKSPKYGMKISVKDITNGIKWNKYAIINTIMKKNIPVFIPTNYPSDLSDEEWAIVEPYFPVGNRSKWHKRSLFNAVLYLVKTGCQWRYLPHGFPPIFTVWSFFHRLRDNGVWETISDSLVIKSRKNAGRNENPTFGIIDSQSVKTVAASEERGFDGGKRIKGRKRHIVVDTMGNLLALYVHAANIHDTKAGIEPAVIAYEKYPTIEKFSGDAGYRKTFVEDVKYELGIDVEISERIKPEFEVLPKRWIVERTLAWLGNSRRLSKDYEITVMSSMAMIFISHIHTLLHRLGRILNLAT